MPYTDVPLTTLPAVLARMAAADVTDAADDDLIMEHIISASDLISQTCQRSFVPYRENRLYDARGEHIDGSTLRLHADLLAITTLTNGDGTLITSGQYALPRGYPKWRIDLLTSAGLSWLYSTDWQNAISIDGLWGYHEDYSSAWVSTGDTVKDTDGINASVQTITVADADGKDARYRLRFQVGHILKIEDEFMRVVAVTAAATNTVIVLRGQLGTTAATHAKDTAISSYAPMRNVEQACISLAIWLHRNRATAGDVIQFMMDGTKVTPSDFPQNVRNILSAYGNVRV